MNHFEVTGTTVLDQAKEIHARHVEANGTDGHTAPDEWRNCQELYCCAFRESISGEEQS